MSDGLVLTEEQQDLRATVRRFLSDTSGREVVRQLAGTDEGFDRNTWLRMATDIGLQALLVPERHDGLGQTPIEAGVVLEEMGRALYPGPFLATVAATYALLLGGDEAACADLMPGIATGTTVATVAVAEASGRWDAVPEQSTTATTGEDGGWLVTGSKSFVLDGLVADLLLVTASTTAGPSLFAVAADAAGLTRTAQESLDLTRRLARVDLEGVPARLVGEQGAAVATVSDLLDRILVAVAAEQTGGAAACLDLSVEYAKTRTQFGRPIGSFQAVAHKCVDLLQAVEFSRACAQFAAASQASGSSEAGVAARVAAAYCGQAFRDVTTETIQVHGGTGFTWEHDAHLYYRRAWSTQQLFGGPEQHWAVLADRVGL